MKRWYAVHTHPQGEQKALAQLQRQGYDAYLPQYLKRRRHARRTDWVRAPLFPRYLFLRLNLDEERWRPVMSTSGVAQMIFVGDRPAALPDRLIEEIRDREDDHGMVELVRDVPFKAGEKVEVLRGAFSDQVGIFDAADDKERVFILLNVLGRDVRVRVPRDSVKSLH